MSPDQPSVGRPREVDLESPEVRDLHAELRDRDRVVGREAEVARLEAELERARARNQRLRRQLDEARRRGGVRALIRRLAGRTTERPSGSDPA